MSLVRASFLNGVAVLVKVASALVLNKIFAVYVGPSGYALIGQFQNVVSILASVAGGLVASGVTKVTAENFDDEVKQHALWQTAIRLSLGSSIIAAVVLLLMGESLAQWVLQRKDMSDLFYLLALSLPSMVVNNLLLAIVNGKKEVRVYVIANIIGSLISMVMSGLLTFNFGLHGALVAFTINPAIVLLFTAKIAARCDWFKVSYFWGPMNRPALRELSGFGLMGLTSALSVPLTFMLIRDNLVTTLGLSAAGYWQASWKISEIYLMLVITTLSTYYLPRLAEIKTANELKVEIVKIYRFVMPVVVMSAAIIYFSRDYIIYTLFAPSFSPMRELFFWQIAGDIVKIGSWILAYIMLGRAMVKTFVVTEIAFSLLFCLLSWLLVRSYGLVGVSMAYALNYSLYWVVMGFIVKSEMRAMSRF
jgi:PST family polysaccharide transporter